MCLQIEETCVLCQKNCKAKYKSSRFLCSDCLEVPHCSSCLSLNVESMTVFQTTEDYETFTIYIKVIACNNEECGSDDQQDGIEVVTVV